ncbi:MAG TPA: glycosyltransferase family 2 protein [Pyrinomonadaceae bacterium]|nr:glycosyltransferase family 2 protein [Pyrinomonadaceae bacterium]
MTDLSIILVNWNAAPVLAECLRRALDELREVSGECIVVDNGSAREDLELIAREFPQVQVIANPVNRGFARAVNQGIRRSRGRYILLLNPDAFLSAGILRAVVSFLDAEPAVGIVGPCVFDADGSLQGSARAFPRMATAIFGRTTLLSRLFPRNPFTRRQVLASRRGDPRQVDWVSGACMFVRRGVFDEVGLLDERYFLYWEDADICRRAREAGWQVVYYPRASVTHLVGVCSERAPLLSLVAFHRSAYRFYRTHVTRSAYHPLNAVAAAGLSARLAATLLWRLVRLSLRPAARPRALLKSALMETDPLKKPQGG